MADKTTNYKLTKPSGDDFYDINVHNENMDIVDAELKKLNDGKAPDGHGLGGIPDPNHQTTFKSVMQKGCGFYQVDVAEDNPVGRNGWMSMLQFPRIGTAGNETGVQLVMADDAAEPRMWYRAMQEGTISDWVEMIHTGNISNYTPKVATGTYVGTGKTKSANPNVLTFGFTPKILFVYCPKSINYRYYEATFLHGCPDAFVRGMGVSTPSNYDGNKLEVTWAANSISWYDKSAEYGYAQLNDENTTYYYVAIG